MKKTNRLSRLLAMLLVLAMLVNSQGMTSMAAVIGGVTGSRRQTEAVQTEALQTEAEAQTEAKQTETAAQTEAVTEASQTETAAQTETELKIEPENESEGLTPAESEAVTETVTENETEAATEALTEAETEIETEEEILEETESESETEEVNEQTVFTYEDDEKVVTATLADPAAVPAGAEFVVEDLTQEEFDSYKAIIAEQMMAEMDEEIPDADKEILVEQALSSLILYDMHFVYNGEEIEPDDSQVSVSIVNKVTVSADTSEVVEGEENLYVMDQEADIEDTYTVVHIKEDGDDVQVEDVTEDVQTNALGDVEAVEFKTDSFSIFGSFNHEVSENNYLTIYTTDDIFSDYSLHYILNHYNLFTRGDADAIHTVGAVVVGGLWKNTAAIGLDKYVQAADSYFADNNSLKNLSDYNQPEQNSGLPRKSLIIEKFTTDIPSIYSYRDYPIVIHTPEKNYVDISAAFNAIQAEVNGYAADPSRIQINITPNQASETEYYKYYHGNDEHNNVVWIVEIKSGFNYEFNTFQGVDRIDIKTDEDNVGNVNIINQQTEIDGMPQVLINGCGGETVLKKYVGDIQIGTGCGVAFILPSATDIDYKGSTETLIGHVVAPKAFVHGLGSGNTNGCFIVNEIQTKAEGHMWPYNGSLIKPTKKGFSAKKTVNGGTPNSTEKFTFILKEFNKDTRQWEEIDRTENNGESIAFDKEIFYGKGSEGTYWYLVSEEQTEKDGYILSNVTYVVKVQVTKPETEYKAESTYYKLNEGKTEKELIQDNGIIDESQLTELESAAQVVFNNIKEAEAEFKVDKTYAYDKDRAFTFKLTAKDGAPMPKDVSGTEMTLSVSDLEDAKTFGKIAYEQPGTYEYEIQEVIPGNLTGDDKKISWDESKYEVRVEVTEDWDTIVSYRKGTQDAQSGYTWGDWTTAEDAIVTFGFENYYNADFSIYMLGTKELTGRTQDAEEFAFDIYWTKWESPILGIKYDRGNILVATAYNQADGSIEFPAIELTKLRENNSSLWAYDVMYGTYTFEVREREGSKGGVTYDTKSRTVEVVIDRRLTRKGYEYYISSVSGDAELKEGKVVLKGDKKFVNEYTSEVTVPFDAKKTVNGKTPAEDEVFEFTLTQTDESWKALTGDAAYSETKTNAGEKVDFTPVIFTQDNLANAWDEEGNITGYADSQTFYYTLLEVQKDQEGYVLDETVYHITVEVSVGADGNLTYAKTITKADDPTTSLTQATFDNKYNTEGTLQLSAKKALKGGRTLANVFSFELYEAVADGVTTLYKTADGSAVKGNLLETKTNSGSAVDFTEITKEEAGTYTYYIKEKAESADGSVYKFSEELYKVVVTMTDDRQGGLTPSYAYYKVEKDGSETKLDKVEDIVFTNVYTASGQLSLEGWTKAVTGKRGKKIENEFSFEVYEGDELKFTGHTVGDGTENADIAFDGAFTYEITEDTDAAGYAAVVKEHTYTIKERKIEKNADGTGIVSDESVYTLVVTVADDGKGHLTPTVKSLSKGNVVLDEGAYTVEQGTDGNWTLKLNNGAAFTNEYTAKGTAELIVNKKLTGNRKKGIQNQEFGFTAALVSSTPGKPATSQVQDSYTGKVQITDGENAVYETVVPIEISFTQADIGQTYVFAVREDDVTDSTVQKDNVVYYAKVVVGDSEKSDGTLETQVSYWKDEACTEALSTEGESAKTGFTFENKYQATGKVALEGTKKLMGREMADGEFTFEVLVDGKPLTYTAEDGEEIPVTATVKDGVFTLALPEYDQDDIGQTFTYTVKEQEPETDKKPHVTYSRKTYTVTVAPQDAGAGELSFTVTIDGKPVNGEPDEAGVYVYEIPKGDQTETGESSASFINKYEDDDSVQFEAEKQVNGEKAEADLVNKFSFVLTETDENWQPLEGGHQDRKENTVSDTDPEHAAQVLFDSIRYDQDDLADKDEAGNIIGYAESRTFYYTIEESKDNVLMGYEYDGAKYCISVVVSIDGAGNLTAVPTIRKEEGAGLTDGLGGIVFNNTYTANGDVVLEAHKTLKGGRTLGANQFTFELHENSADGTVLGTKTNDASGNVVFNTISYSLDTLNSAKTATKTYYITERTGSVNGYTYSKAIYKVVVTIEDKGAGELEVSKKYYKVADDAGTSVEPVENGEVAEFVNSYAAEGDLSLTGWTKAVEGGRAKKIEQSEFTFEVYEGEGEAIAEADPIFTGHTEDGEADIANIVFEEVLHYEVTAKTTLEQYQEIVGTHTYTIKEQRKDLNADGTGVETDTAVYVLTVTVADNNAGMLVPTITSIKKNGIEIGVKEKEDGTAVVLPDGAAFTNQYLAKGVGTLEATKKLTGQRNGTDEIEADEFSFKATLINPPTLPTGTGLKTAGADGSIVYTGTVEESADGTSKVDFEQISFTQADIGGTYIFAITEDDIDPDQSKSVSKDENTYYAKITVSDKDEIDGTLETSVTYWKDAACEAEEIQLNDVVFVNEYQAEGQVALKGTKKLTGREMEDGEFTFEVLEGGEPLTYTDENGSEIPVIATVNGGVFTLTLPEYDQDDVGTTFTYMLREQVPENKKNVTYSPDTYTVAVTPKDNATGELSFEVKIGKNAATPELVEGELNETTGVYEYTIPGETTFTNTYADEEKIQFKAEKKVNDVPADADLAEAFTFTLTETNGNWEPLADKDAEIKKNEKVTDAEGNETAAEVLFDEITYDQDSLKNSNGGYDKEKKFYYVIEESATVPAGYTYDGTKYCITVTVTLGADGELTVTKTVEKKVGEGMLSPAGEIVFNNTYKADGEEILTAKKVLTGRNTLEAGQFTFELYGSNADGTIGDLIASKAIDASGSVTFAPAEAVDGEELAPELKELTDALTYDLDDAGSTKTYYIKEYNDEKAGYTYSSTLYKVEVEITDKGNGKLETEKQYYRVEKDGSLTKVEEAAVEFANEYEASGTLTLTGWHKQVTGNRGKDIEPEEFKFSVYEVLANGTLVAQTTKGATVAGDSEKADITFSPDISYNVTGKMPAEQYNEVVRTHTYLVTEDDVADKHVKKDSTQYEITVDVTDDGASHLSATVTSVTKITVDEAGNKTRMLLMWGPSIRPDVTFVNEYTATGSVLADGLKLVNGERPTQAQIDRLNGLVSFQLSQIEGTDETVLESKSLDAEGKFRFADLAYTQDDIGKTFTYRMQEVQIAEDSEMGGYTVDTAPRDFTVTVEDSDDHDGTLKLTVKDADGNETDGAPELYAEFDNTLTIEFHVDKTEVGDHSKEVAGAEITVYEITTDENGETVETKVDSWTSDGEESHDFGDKLKAGGSYVLRETVAPDGYAYTNDIEFNVTENGEVVTDMEHTTGENGETVYLVEDAPITGSVTLRKTSETTGDLLSGAAFQLYYRTDGTESGWAPYNNASYTTDIDGTLTVSGLPANDYYFVETQAPEGFVTGTDENGEPKQYPFTVGLDETDRTKAEITVELGVTNAPEAVDTSLVVTKQLVYNNELWNAVDATFYVALYDDEALTNRVSEIQPIEFRNMNTSSTTFEKLEVGKTYYVGETNKDGIVLNNLGGALATGEMFMVDFYNDNVVTIERGDGTQTVYFRNQFTELPREFYREGELTVTKQLLNAGGALQPGNETFYAGIFADAELTTLSKDVSKNIVPLPMNGLAMVSDIVKVTVPEGGRTTVYVAEVDAAGNPVAGAASFQYDVTVDGAVVTMDEENLKGSVVITNQEREKESETETEEEETEVYREKSEETEEFVVPSSTKSVKTGDETPIMLYVGLLAAAALLLILALVLKRRKRS